MQKAIDTLKKEMYSGKAFSQAEWESMIEGLKKLEEGHIPDLHVLLKWHHLQEIKDVITKVAELDSTPQENKDQLNDVVLKLQRTYKIQ